MALVGSNCGADETVLNGGEEAWSGVDVPVDATLLVDRSEESETMGEADASADLAAADVPNDATPPAGDDAGETTAPGPAVLRTATFALG